VEIFAQKHDLNVMLELAPIIGSLAQYDASLLIEAGVLTPLFEALNENDKKVMESCARALRAIVQDDTVSSKISEAHIKSLIALSKTPKQITKTNINIAQVCISTLARLAENNKLKKIISDSNGVEILASWLNEEFNQYPPVQEAVLDSLSSLAKDSPHLASAIGYHIVGQDPSGKTVFVILFKLLNDKRPFMRLSASTWYRKSNQSNTFIQCRRTIKSNQSIRNPNLSIFITVRDPFIRRHDYHCEFFGNVSYYNSRTCCVFIFRSC
jgi:DNA-binding TFAR19-related protein (PDSD5 family)